MFGAKLLEIHHVVQHLPCVVEQAAFRLLDNLADRLALQPAAWQQAVEVIHVCLQMFTVMETQRADTNHMQCVSSIRQLHHFKNPIDG